MVIIREMEPHEYPAVMRLWSEAGLPVKPWGRDAPERVEAERQSGRAIFLVAESRGRLVGVVIGTHDGRKGWINRLAVAPAYRRQGIASRLVSEAEQRLTALGLEVVAALIESTNAGSLALFTALGYQHDPGVEYVSRRSSPEA